MRIPVIPVHSVGNLAKTEHAHPLGMVVSTHFRCGKRVKRGLKNGALPFSTLWNLNYGADVVKDSFRVVKEANDDVKDVVKRKVNVAKTEHAHPLRGKRVRDASIYASKKISLKYLF